MKSWSLLFLLVTLTQGQYLREIQTQTASDGRMNSGNIQVRVHNRNALSCLSNNLDTEGNNYQNYQTDTFELRHIGPNCTNFEIPGGEVPFITVYHHLTDGWKSDWIRVIMDDQSFRVCPGSSIDEDQEQQWACY